MIETPRLILRPWIDADVAEFVRATNTPAVMGYLGGVADEGAIQATVARIMASARVHGFCFWLMERRADRALLGFCGLRIGTAGPVTGEMEIGWRLREDAWGQGYAREAAQASLDWAWRNRDCERIFAITVPGNRPSWGLMERLGMRRRADLDFDHPNFAPGHPLCAHITYCIERPEPGQIGPADAADYDYLDKEILTRGV